MLAVVAFVLFVIAAIVAFLGKSHSDAIAYAGLALLALQLVFPWAPWQRAV
jgi:hypothetical protein